jgi:DNA replication and repair protein RecF
VKVTRVSLRDFRNYERADLRPAEGITVVCGPNGAGKTNLIEGLYFGLTGRSCRTANERELVRAGAPLTRVSVEIGDEDGSHFLEVGFEPGQPKLMRVDGAAPGGSATLGVRPPVIAFLPDRLVLVKGPPAHRRSHLDRFVAALWPARSESRTAYGRALAQRNALLARVRAGSSAAGQLDAWDAELGEHGTRLMADRAEAGALLAPRFAELAEELGLADDSELRYRPRSRGSTASELAAELEERRADDLARGFTTHGPHRDDVVLRHAGRPLRSFGSQGQQRLALLALLLAERDVLAAHSHASLMLLDDVMSELDAERRGRLVGLVGGGQALITTTDTDQVPGADAPEVAVATVAEGKVRVSEPAVAA